MPWRCIAPIFSDGLSKRRSVKRRGVERGTDPRQPITRTTEFAMLYVLAIYESPDAFDARDGEERGAYMGAWQAYADALRHAGVLAGGKGLEPPSAATTVRFRDGERTVQDGPYADTKEQLGGFFILDVPDLDAALEWAARCPVYQGGGVEVRPAMQSCQAAANGSVATKPALASA
jgi:hypothetical protein